MTPTNLPSLIVSEKTAVLLFESLARLSNAKQLSDNRVEAFTVLWFNDAIGQYMASCASTLDRRFAANYFVHTEIQFIVECLKSAAIRKLIADKSVILQLTFKLVTCLGDHQMDDLLFLLNNIIFDIAYYTNKSIFRRTNLNDWNTTYVKIIMQEYFIRTNGRNGKPAHNYDRGTILVNDWPCVMVRAMYETMNTGQGMKANVDF